MARSARRVASTLKF